jgi:DNA-binding CsgD family transcriptional regulator
VVGLALCRARRDFSGRDRQLVECLRPHLGQAYRTAEAATAARQESALARAGLESAGTGTLWLDEGGRVRDLSDLGLRRVEDYFGPVRQNRLPAALAAWAAAAREGLAGELPAPPRPLVVEQGGARLVVRLLRQSRRSLVLLREERSAVDREALGRVGLSRRETDVLAWVAEGKTNLEVAAIRGLSPRTVGNHLARIYTRLGVETRTAAARIALTGT